MNERFLADLQAALETKTKKGALVFDNYDDLEVSVAGTFAADKFIVIKRKSEFTPETAG
jgi:hypothetical protein